MWSIFAKDVPNKLESKEDGQRLRDAEKTFVVVKIDAQIARFYANFCSILGGIPDQPNNYNNVSKCILLNSPY